MDTNEPTTIIAGVDGTGHSADALALAHALAAPLGAAVLPYRVQPPAEATGGSDRSAIRAPAAVLDAPVAQRVGTLVSDRSAARELEWMADERRALLIAIGATSRSRLGRLFLGDTGGQLMAGSERPVAVAPAGYADGAARMDTIGVAFDGSPEARAALVWAIAFAREAGSRLLILTVHEPARAAIPAYHGLPLAAEEAAVRDELGRRLAVATQDAERAGVEVDGRLLEGHAATVLAQQSADVDLLVVGTRERGPARAALFGSVSKHLAHKARGPVVVVPRAAAASGGSAAPA
jgi:nucleotide-binding universal stress UspA family protein